MNISLLPVLIPALVLLAGNVSSVSGQLIWPQFRGPGGQGVSTAQPPPAVFGMTSNRLWSLPLPPGHSSPVLVGDHLFLTADAGNESNRLQTIAINRRTGKLLWQNAAPASKIEKVHAFASPAAPSPLATEDRVITYFGSYGLLCYDHAGRELWSKPLPPPKSTYGTSSSPIQVGRTAVVVLDSDDKSSRILAVNLADGSTAWETPRPLSGSGWATPLLWEHDGQSKIVVLGSRRLIAYDARTGQDLWWLDGYSPETISMPVTGEGWLFVSSSGLAGPPSDGFESMSWPDLAKLDLNGDGQVQKSEVPKDFRFTLRPELPLDHPGRYIPSPFLRMFDGVDGNRDGAITQPEFATFLKQWSARSSPSLRAIRPGGKGDVTRTHVAWQMSRGIPEIPSPLFHQGRIYLVRDGGFVTCVKAGTGEMIYQERVGAAGSYCASPVAAGDKIFVTSHSGIVSCLSAKADEMTLLARNNLGEKVWATPALAEGTIYVRTEKTLHAFATPGK